MKKKHALLLLSISLSMPIAAQINWKTTIPSDPQTIKGVLPNGLTYYIRHNEEPKGRASFYIIRNAGSVLENDEQNGLAHFLEHMAFNGSKNFEPNELVRTLQRHSISYGGDLNAYTNHNETVYHISNAEVSDKGLIDTCLLVLHDWSYYLNLSDKEIDKERGVIMGEWRSINNAHFRMRNRIDSIIYKGSPYAIRNVIGDTTVIKTFKHQALRDFYHNWYRTDLSAIAIVGDFDAREMEKRVKDIFSPIPKATNASERFYPVIPSHENPRYVLATDKEAVVSTIIVNRIFRDPALDRTTPNTYQGVKDEYCMQFFNKIISDRINEKIQQNKSSYINAQIILHKDRLGYHSYTIGASAKDGTEAEVLKDILEENQRIMQHGFLRSEFERAVQEAVANLETSYQNREKLFSNDSYIGNYQENFLHNEGYENYEDYYKAARIVIDNITLDDINAIARKYWKKDNRSISIQGPSKATHLSEEEALAILEASDYVKTTQYDDGISEGSLISNTEVLKGAKITKIKNIPQFDAEEWTLGNGAKVVYKFVDHDKDQIAIQAFSKGGGSKVPIDKIPTKDLLNQMVSNYGIGDFDAVTAGKMLAGKNVNSSIMLSPLFEEINGSSNKKDFETAMQLLYLRFQHPRFDKTAQEAFMSRMAAIIPAFIEQPEFIIQDSLTLISYDYHPRAVASEVTKDYLSKISLKKAEEIYRDRYRDAQDFTFLIVGDIKRDSAILMAEKYIGSIPKGDRKENWTDNKMYYPDRDIEKVIEVPNENPSANVYLIHHCQMPYTYKNVYAMQIMSQILGDRCDNIIREEKGGTYGVACRGDNTKIPRNDFFLTLNFECSDKDAIELKNDLYKQIERIITKGVTEEEVRKFGDNWLKEREQGKMHNSYWTDKLLSFYELGDDFNADKNSVDIIKNMTAKDVNSFACNFFKKAKKIDLVFMPKKPEQANTKE